MNLLHKYFTLIANSVVYKLLSIKNKTIKIYSDISLYIPNTITLLKVLFRINVVNNLQKITDTLSKKINSCKLATISSLQLSNEFVIKLKEYIYDNLIATLTVFNNFLISNTKTILIKTKEQFFTSNSFIIATVKDFLIRTKVNISVTTNLIANKVKIFVKQTSTLNKSSTLLNSTAIIFYIKVPAILQNTVELVFKYILTPIQYIVNLQLAITNIELRKVIITIKNKIEFFVSDKYLDKISSIKLNYKKSNLIFGKDVKSTSKIRTGYNVIFSLAGDLRSTVIILVKTIQQNLLISNTFFSKIQNYITLAYESTLHISDRLLNSNNLKVKISSVISNLYIQSSTFQISNLIGFIKSVTTLLNNATVEITNAFIFTFNNITITISKLEDTLIFKQKAFNFVKENCIIKLADTFLNCVGRVYIYIRDNVSLFLNDTFFNISSICANINIKPLIANTQSTITNIIQKVGSISSTSSLYVMNSPAWYEYDSTTRNLKILRSYDCEYDDTELIID